MTTRTFLPAFSLAVLLVVAGFAWPRSAPPEVEATPATAATPSDVVSWTLDAAHSEVRFSVRHLAISRVTGHFRSFKAEVAMDPDDVSTLSTSAVVEIPSIDTGNDKRDEHLRSPDFFDASAYPEMTFQSTGVENVDGNAFQLMGDLSIKGTTQPVVFDAELIGTAVGPEGKQRAAFTATTTINRKEFGLTWDKLTEAGGVIVGEDVEITLDVQTVREAS